MEIFSPPPRELANRQGVGEEAAAVWKALQARRDDYAPAAETAPSTAVENASDTVAAEEVSDGPLVWVIQPSRPMEQMSLF